MKTRKMAEDFIKRGRRFHREAESAFMEHDYATSVRRSQECVEMSLKAMLRLLGIEYPLKHDVSDVIKEIDASTLPHWFARRLGEFSEISTRLAKQRGPAMYGSEDELKPASELFDKKDASKALTDSTKVLGHCEKLIKSLGEQWQKER